MISFDFGGRVVIVTGAARGVGRALVNAFVGAGAQVVATDRDAAGLAETCAPHGERVASIIADVSAVAGAAAIVGRALEHFGSVNVCVNNAAGAPAPAPLRGRVE